MTAHEVDPARLRIVTIRRHEEACRSRIRLGVIPHEKIERLLEEFLHDPQVGFLERCRTSADPLADPGRPVQQSHSRTARDRGNREWNEREDRSGVPQRTIEDFAYRWRCWER